MLHVLHKRSKCNLIQNNGPQFKTHRDNTKQPPQERQKRIFMWPIYIYKQPDIPSKEVNTIFTSSLIALGPPHIQVGI